MTKKVTLKITGVNASTIAMFEGTLAAVIGLGAAILFSLSKTVEIAESTNNLLAGLAFGMSAGIISIILLPFIYFGIGWLIGYFHGWVFNVIVKSAGGIAIDTEQ